MKVVNSVLELVGGTPMVKLRARASGANVYASTKVAKELGKEKTVVTVLPDNAYRYFSTDLFKDL